MTENINRQHFCLYISPSSNTVKQVKKEWQTENYIFKQIMKRPEELKKLKRNDVADSVSSLSVSRNDESV